MPQTWRSIGHDISGQDGEDNWRACSFHQVAGDCFCLTPAIFYLKLYAYANNSSYYVTSQLLVQSSKMLNIEGCNVASCYFIEVLL